MWYRFFLRGRAFMMYIIVKCWSIKRLYRVDLYFGSVVGDPFMFG